MGVAALCGGMGGGVLFFAAGLVLLSVPRHEK